MLLVILSIAIFRFRYRVSIDNNSITIQGLFVKKIDFDEICDLSVQSYRGLTSLLIESKTGKKVEVGSDLVDFLVFVQTATSRYEMRRKISRS